MSWAEHIARMGKRRGEYRVFVGETRSKNHLEHLDANVRIILKWSFSEYGGRTWYGLIWLRKGTSCGLM
jgi:hypothetical protein